MLQSKDPLLELGCKESQGALYKKGELLLSVHTSDVLPPVAGRPEWL